MDEELKRKLLFTLLALVIYRIGAHIAAPGVNVTALADFIRNSAAAGFFGLRPQRSQPCRLCNFCGEILDKCPCLGGIFDA